MGVPEIRTKNLNPQPSLWARRSNMLAPLTSLVGECGQTKSTKAKGTKKVPWHWMRSIKEHSIM
jgi:hypothetical protein